MRSWRPELRARLASLRLTPAREAAIVEELSQHLDDRRQELIAGGLSEDVATAIVLRELQNADRLTEGLGTLRQAHTTPAAPPGVPSRRTKRPRSTPRPWPIVSPTSRSI